MKKKLEDIVSLMRQSALAASETEAQVELDDYADKIAALLSEQGEGTVEFEGWVVDETWGKRLSYPMHMLNGIPNRTKVHVTISPLPSKVVGGG